MAVSGSDDFDATVTDMVQFAIRKINLVGAGQSIPGYLRDEAVDELELMLKEWMRDELIWRKTDGVITLRAPSISGITQANPGVVTTTAAHGLTNRSKVSITGVSGMTEVNGPEYTVANVSSTTFELSGVDTSGFTAWSSGGTVLVQGYALSSPYPYRIIEARFRQTVNSLARDIPMIDLTWGEYKELPVKGTTGIPTQFHFNPQRRNANDPPIFYVWPVLNTIASTNETIEYTYHRFIEDIDAATNIDVPSDWLSTVQYNLAARLADNFGRSGGHIDRIIQRAEMLHQQAMDADRDDIVQFEPEYRHG